MEIRPLHRMQKRVWANNTTKSTEKLANMQKKRTRKKIVMKMAFGSSSLSLSFIHIHSRSMACKWRATMLSFYPKCISCGCAVVAVANIHTHTNTTHASRTPYLFGVFPHFPNCMLSALHIQWGARNQASCLPPKFSLSLSLLRVCASFERIISCKIRRCHFVSVFMHTAYTRTHTKNTNTNARVRHFLFGTKRIFAPSLYRFDFDEFLINFENRHVQNGKLKRTKMFIFSLSISFTVLNSEIFSCLTFSILRDSKKDQRSKWKSEEKKRI